MAKKLTATNVSVGSKATPLIPFKFSPSSSAYETDHLVFREESSVHFVAWPVIGAELVAGTPSERADLEAIKKANGGIFKVWDKFGFSLGAYHEFFCGELPDTASFQIGSVEVSFGQATPLAAYLFDDSFDDDFFGAWEFVTSARISGCSADVAEAIFINAALHYERTLKVLPQPMKLEGFSWPDEADSTGTSLIRLPPAVIEPHPLHFYYNGMLQVDATAACIYHYRVLEYFAFGRTQREISRLRHDATLSDVEFNRQILELVTRDERGPLVRLVAQLADKSVLELALHNGLVKSPEASLLGIELYSFRNSITHGKQSHGYDLSLAAVISSEPRVLHWREILKRLSEKALQTHGRRLS